MTGSGRPSGKRAGSDVMEPLEESRHAAQHGDEFLTRPRAGCEHSTGECEAFSSKKRKIHKIVKLTNLSRELKVRMRAHGSLKIWTDTHARAHTRNKKEPVYPVNETRPSHQSVIVL